jgi:DNA (cytosine-5)-methyltransferase 1
VSRRAPLTFYEFFAGGGMARVGLGPGWRPLFANDVDARKVQTYRANFGRGDLRQGDVWELTAADLPGRADLAWASSPCQDVSLAGSRAGLSGKRSSAFWGFWRLIEALAGEGRAPRAIGIENVVGLLSSHGGSDFAAVCAALAGLGYRFGALEIDAALFTPQSRPRMFLIATLEPTLLDLGQEHLTGGAGAFHSPAVRQAFEALPAQLKSRWVWWRLPEPPRRNTALADVLEPDDEVPWLGPQETDRLIALMNPLHRARLDQIRARGERCVGAVYRRMRVEAGARVQRAEARFDGLAGCLRTPAGGSSRQFLLIADAGAVRARLLGPREAARLMGLEDDYRLPASASAALKVMGDGVAAPAVRHLARHILEPLLAAGAMAAA